MHVNSPAWADENQLKCEKVLLFSDMSEINSRWVIFNLYEWQFFRTVYSITKTVDTNATFPAISIIKFPYKKRFNAVEWVNALFSNCSRYKNASKPNKCGKRYTRGNSSLWVPMMDVIILAVVKLIDEDIFFTDTDAWASLLSLWFSFYIEWSTRFVSLSPSFCLNKRSRLNVVI